MLDELLGSGDLTPHILNFGIILSGQPVAGLLY